MKVRCIKTEKNSGDYSKITKTGADPFKLRQIGTVTWSIEAGILNKIKQNTGRYIKTEKK